MAAIKLKSEKRIKQVVTSGGSAENANTYESDDIVYSQSDDSLKKSDGTNWQDLPLHPITKYYLTTDGSDTAYRWNGPGFNNDDDPTVYLVRGQKYQFENLMGGHGFRISDSEGGAAYTDGITNNNVTNGVLEWDVQQNVPNTMYYQCVSHAAMKGQFKILDASGGGGATNFTGLSDTPGSIGGGDANKFVKVNGSGNALEFSTVSIPGAIGDLSDVPAPGGGDANKFVKVNGSGGALEYVSQTIPANIADLGDVPTFGGGDALKLLRVNSGASAIEYATADSFNPMLHNQAIGGSNLTWNAGSGHGQQMNSGTGGIVIVTQSGSSSQTSAAAQYLELDTRVAQLNRTEGKWKYEFYSGDQSKAFRLKIINGDSSNGLATLVTSSDFAAIAQNGEKEIAGNQVFVLQYDGSQWKYYIRAW